MLDFVIRNDQDIENFIKQRIDFDESQLIGLIGNLGAGKTRFVQVLAKMLGVKENVNSPTFIIQNEYEFAGGILHHIDLYRVETLTEFNELKIESLFDGKFFICVEWADKFEKELKFMTAMNNVSKLFLKIDYLNETERAFTIQIQTTNSDKIISNYDAYYSD